MASRLASDSDAKLASCSDFTRRTMAAIHEIVLRKHPSADRRPVSKGFSYWTGDGRLFRLDPKQERIAVEIGAETARFAMDALRPVSRKRPEWIDITPENVGAGLKFIEARLL